MRNLNVIYSNNLFFTVCAFFVGLALPYSRGNYLAISLLLLLTIILYIYLGSLLVNVIKELGKKETSINELKFLFIT